MKKEVFVDKYVNHTPIEVDLEICKNIKKTLIEYEWLMENQQIIGEVRLLSKKQAKNDAKLFFEILEIYYSGYEYYKDKIDNVKSLVLDYLDKCEVKWTNVLLAEKLYNELKNVIIDGHFSILAGDSESRFYKWHRVYVTDLLVEEIDDKYVVIKGNKKIPVGTLVENDNIKEWLLPTLSILTNNKCFLIGKYSDVEIKHIAINDIKLKTHIIKSDLYYSRSSEIEELENLNFLIEHRNYNVFINKSYMRVDDWENTVKEFYDAGVKSKNKKYTIFDVAGNRGGYSGYPENFIKGLNDYANWKTDLAIINNPISHNDLKIKKYDIILGKDNESDLGTYEGKLFVVMNKWTGSSGESAVAFAYSCKNVTFVGAPTAGVGQFGDILIYKLPNSNIILTVPYKVFQEEKIEECIGFIPDYYIDDKNPVNYMKKYIKNIK